ncbi:MAG TPA: hypothetical protein VF581_01710 [Flavobacterium sp.]|jgi:hypothetical protein
MTKLRLISIALFMLAGISQVQAQTYKFLTTGFSVLEKDAKGNWGKWSDLEEASIIITLDTNKNRVVVYSQEIQLYQIMDYLPEEENENDIIYPFTCMTEEGDRVAVTIITRKKQNNRKQLYITHNDVIVVYNIVNFPEKNR